MNLTPGPYLWRMRQEDEYRLVEVFHDKNNGAMFCMCGSNYTHRPTYGHEFVRLVPENELKLAFEEGKCQNFGWGLDWEQSRAKKVAEGEES